MIILYKVTNTTFFICCKNEKTQFMSCCDEWELWCTTTKDLQQQPQLKEVQEPWSTRKYPTSIQHTNTFFSNCSSSQPQYKSIMALSHQPTSSSPFGKLSISKGFILTLLSLVHFYLLVFRAPTRIKLLLEASHFLGVHQFPISMKAGQINMKS